MSPETRAFLAGVRHAEDPTPRDERRVLASVNAALAAGSMAGASVVAAKTTKFFGIFGLSGAKLGGALFCVGAAVLVASWVPSRRGPAEAAHVGVLPVPAIATTSRATTNAEGAAVKNERAAPPVSAAPVPEKSVPSARTEARRATSLRREIELLAGVRSALERGHAGEALRRLDEHVTADRQFSAERSAARVLALCSLGRASDAREAAVVFFRNHPGSVQAGAVERSCAGERTNDER